MEDPGWLAHLVFLCSLESTSTSAYLTNQSLFIWLVGMKISLSWRALSKPETETTLLQVISHFIYLSKQNTVFAMI